jgi:hypothetical protein
MLARARITALVPTTGVRFEEYDLSGITTHDGVTTRATSRRHGSAARTATSSASTPGRTAESGGGPSADAGRRDPDVAAG